MSIILFKAFNLLGLAECLGDGSIHQRATETLAILDSRQHERCGDPSSAEAPLLSHP